jgi:hypothetical protein
MISPAVAVEEDGAGGVGPGGSWVGGGRGREPERDDVASLFVRRVAALEQLDLIVIGGCLNFRGSVYVWL